MKTIRLIGEKWTEDELADARAAMGAVYEGVGCGVPHDRMRKLARRGLLSSLIKLPGRGRYANRYEYMWRDKLEKLVTASTVRLQRQRAGR